MNKSNKISIGPLVIMFCLFSSMAYGADQRPNIIVIFGDDIGQDGTDKLSAAHRSSVDEYL